MSFQPDAPKLVEGAEHHGLLPVHCLGPYDFAHNGGIGCKKHLSKFRTCSTSKQTYKGIAAKYEKIYAGKSGWNLVNHLVAEFKEKKSDELQLQPPYHVHSCQTLQVL
jgi:hypothetical protein